MSDVSITVSESCTFKGIIGSPHTASIESGRLVQDIGTTTLKAFCNDNGGFSIYAIGYTDEEYGKTVLSSQTIGDAKDIATGTNTTGNSSWAMKLDNSQSTTYPIELDNGFGSYSAVPSSYTQVAHRNGGTDLGTEATGAILTTTYQAYIASEQPADSYQGKVKYTMVHPSTEVPNQPHITTANKIGYYPNASGLVDTMADQSASSNTKTVLWPSNFQRPGYGFAGWNDKFDMTGTNYGPMETITTPDLTTTGLSLYANWIKSAGTMQNWTGCSSMSIGDITALTDSRDNNTYAVAKLADGNCWMIENLRLADAHGSPSTATILTTANTNNPLNTDGAVTLKNTDGTTTDHLSASTNPTTTAWCNSSSSACYDQSMLYTGNTVGAVSNMQGTDVNVYSYGNYYNWYSATAGKGTYSSGSGAVAAGDICPQGWHLPYGGSRTSTRGGNTPGGFYYLNYKLNNDTNTTDTTASKIIRAYPNNFVYSGYVTRSLVSSRGSLGYYWSSTAYSNYYAYDLYFYSSSVYPGTNNLNSKHFGRTVRCVAQ